MAVMKGASTAAKRVEKMAAERVDLSVFYMVEKKVDKTAEMMASKTVDEVS